MVDAARRLKWVSFQSRKQKVGNMDHWILFWIIGKKRTRCSVGHREILMMRSIHLVSMMHGDFFHVWQTCWCRCRSCFSFSSCFRKDLVVFCLLVFWSSGCKRGSQCANGFEFLCLKKMNVHLLSPHTGSTGST